VLDEDVDASNVHVLAHLKKDFIREGQKFAGAGALVKGHVELVDRHGQVIKRTLAKERWISRRPPFRLVFDELVYKGKHVIDLHAVPLRQHSMFSNGTEFRTVNVETGGIVSASGFVDRDEVVPNLLVKKSVMERGVSLKQGDEIELRNRREQTNEEPAPVSGMSNLPAKVATSWPDALNSNAKSDDSAGSISVSPEIPDTLHSATKSSASHDSMSAPAAGKGFRVLEAQYDVPSKNGSAKSNDSVAPSLKKSRYDESLLAEQEARAKAPHEEKMPSSNQFRIAFETPVDSTSATTGDKIAAKLLDDLSIGDCIIAKSGSTINGAVCKIQRPKRLANSLRHKGARMQRGATLKIAFDSVYSTDGKCIKIGSNLPKQTSVFNNNGKFKQIEVDESGNLIRDLDVVRLDQSMGFAAPKSAVRMGLTMVLGPAAALVAPGVMAAVNAAQPKIANGVQTMVARGSELSIAAGDQVFVEAQIKNIDQSRRFVSSKVFDSTSKPSRQ